MFRNKEKIEFKDLVKIFGPAIVITIIGFIIAYQFVAPSPPKHVAIGTGPRDGAYYTYGKAYSEILAGEGITLEVKCTAGSAENVKLLGVEAGGVDIAFVQGGSRSLSQTNHLVSLASLYFEPLWIFHKTDIPLKRLSDLQGLRVAIGVEGSSAKILTTRLLDLNGVHPKNTQILSYGGQKAAHMLLNGELDVAIFVTTHRASYITELLKSRLVNLMGLERAEAYALRYHYLYVLKLPEGVIDFERNIPSRDLTLVAPTTQLVARSDLHPALIDLLLKAAKEIHGTGGGFEKKGEFPSMKHLDFELSQEAGRFFKSGPLLLQRYLPFWLANFLKRMKVMILPFLALLYPLFRLTPAVFRWRMRSRIYRWYSELEAIDPEIHKKDVTAQIDGYISHLDRLDKKISKISVPLAFTEELYQLRLHIDMLKNRLHQLHGKDRRVETKPETSSENDI